MVPHQEVRLAGSIRSLIGFTSVPVVLGPLYRPNISLAIQADIVILGETIPIRLFLGGFDLTPTFREVNKKYSTRYYLSLVLIDEGKTNQISVPATYAFRIHAVSPSREFIMLACMQRAPQKAIDIYPHTKTPPSVPHPCSSHTAH